MSLYVFGNLAISSITMSSLWTWLCQLAAQRANPKTLISCFVISEENEQNCLPLLLSTQTSWLRETKTRVGWHTQEEQKDQEFSEVNYLSQEFN